MVYHTHGLYELDKELCLLDFFVPGLFMVSRSMQEFNFMEFYAGHANLTRAMRRAGKKAARFDILYGKKKGSKRKRTARAKSDWMDLLQPSGYVLLV